MLVTVRFLVFALLSLFFLSLAPTPLTYAAAIEVPCGDTAALIAAIHTANSTREKDTIILGEDCLYRLDQVDNQDHNDGSNGLPVIMTKIIIRGQGARIERVNSPDTPPFRFFMVSPGGKLVLKNLQLAFGGYTGVPNLPEYAFPGGAIYNVEGKVILNRVYLIRNRVNDTHVGYGRREQGQGGAIYSDGGTLKLSHSGVAQSYAIAGGGIRTNAGTRLLIRDSSFLKNRSKHSGGAIYTYGVARIRTSNFWRNETGDPSASDHRGEQGGAIANWNILSVSSSTFTFNKAPNGLGGAIYSQPAPSFETSSFYSNHAKNGGAIWACCKETIIANSTFNQNSASDVGGALELYGGQLVNVTLANNTSNQNGGNLMVGTDYPTVIGNTIITEGLPQNCIGNLVDGGGNLRFPESDLTCQGDFGDPMLADWDPIANHPPVMPLQPGSRAINKGLRENCLRAPVNNLDQRGIKRVIGDEPHCDSGAYEVE